MIKFVSMCKDSCELKYRLPINKRESVVIICFKDPQTFIEFSNNIKSFDKNTDDCNSKQSPKL